MKSFFRAIFYISALCWCTFMFAAGGVFAGIIVGIAPAWVFGLVLVQFGLFDD